MKIAEGFALKTIADTKVVVPTGTNTVSFRSIISLNDSGAFIWKQLENDTNEQTVINALLKEYDIDEETARADLKEFIEKMRAANLLNE